MYQITFGQPESDNFRWALSVGLPSLAGMVGVVIGAWLASQRDKKNRRMEFLERQISSLYSPILGIRDEICAGGEIRHRLQQKSNEVWRQSVERVSGLDPEKQRRFLDERQPEYERQIKYDNDKFASDVLPRYRQILSIVRENRWLAEPGTVALYAGVFEFVEIWNRCVEGAMPREVSLHVTHDGDKMDRFMNHIQQQHDLIRAKIKAGAPSSWLDAVRASCAAIKRRFRQF